MESRTERLLRALGNREAFAVVYALLKQEATTNGLATVTGLTAATLEPTLEVLSQAGIVTRHRGPQGAWYLTHWHETLAMFRYTRRLGIAMQATDDHLDTEEGALFEALEEAQGAAAAAKRGRRKPDGE